MTHLIPKNIHYCWFGHGEKPKKIKKCMNSWKKHLPDYRFIEWNEAMFDVHSIQYVKQAYEARKFAFVSDYVRLHALYHHGGIYLDTDVEVLQPLDRFLVHDAFSGFEDHHYLQSATMGASKGNRWIKGLLAHYEDLSFLQQDGTFDLTTNTAMMSSYCKRQGLILDGSHQELKEGVVIYPRTYFSPYDYINGSNYLSKESYTIHHFAQSWLPRHVRLRGELKKIAGRYLGPQFIVKLRTIFK